MNDCEASASSLSQGTEGERGRGGKRKVKRGEERGKRGEEVRKGRNGEEEEKKGERE